MSELSESQLEPELSSDHVVAHDTDDATQRTLKRPRKFSERYLLPILYLITFLFYYGENIQPAPRTQIYELVICHRLHGGESIVLDDNICKSHDVQKELAFLKGMERLLGIFPTVLAIPYGLLANRCGRSFVFTLAIFGLFLEEFWNFLICWFSSFLPIRLVLLGPAFEIVGGGSAVSITMLHVIAADAVSEQDRNSTFLRIHATGVAAGVAAQVTASLFMNFNNWLPWFLGILMLLFAAAAATIVPKWPKKRSDSSIPTVTSPLLGPATLPSVEIKIDNSLRASFADALNRLKGGFHIVFGNGQLMLLLWAAFLARLGDDSYAMILLLYIPKRFSWDFAKANLFSALGDSVQFLSLVILLPLMSKVLVNHYHMSAHTKDLRIAIISMVTLSIGAFLVGFGPQIWVAAIGVFLFSLAGGVQSILRSLVTSSISPSEISLVYSVFTILQRISNALAGPLYSGAFTAGLYLGTSWVGLPFMVAGGLVVLAIAGVMFVDDKHTYEQVPDDDSEN